MNLTNLSTSELYAYADILQDVIQSNNGVIHHSEEAIKHNFGKKSDFEDIIKEARSNISEAEPVFIEIQKEMDQRLKKNFKVHKGIGTSQRLLKKLDTLVRSVHEENLKNQKAAGTKVITADS